jgi:hypothetical protein
MTELEWTIGVLEELLFEERDDPESLSNGYGKALRNRHRSTHRDESKRTR